MGESDFEERAGGFRGLDLKTEDGLAAAGRLGWMAWGFISSLVLRQSKEKMQCW